MNGIGEIPETGAIFTLGKSKFADNIPSCFWLKNDKVVQVSCGDEHTAMLTQDGKVYVFGSNDWGQLGLGHTHVVAKPTCIKSLKTNKCKLLTCGRNHTLVYTETKEIFSFGNNNDSQLGPFEKSSYNSPVSFNTANWGEIKELRAGADFSIALTVDGKLYVWGSNGEGQLGIGADKNEVKEPILLDFDGSIKHISCGYYHTAFCTKSGELYTFGENENFKLGDHSNTDTSVPVKVNTSVFVKNVDCGGSHTAFLSEEGHLYTFGDGSHGQLGQGTETLHSAKPICIERLMQHPIESVHCGENFTVAITKGGKLYTFGDGRYGKLGVGEENFTNQFKPFRCHQFSNYFVYQASCGGCHLIVLATNRQKDHIASSESEIEDPLHSISHSKPIQFNPMNTIAGETMNNSANANLNRTLSAREKRRQARQTNLLSQTLPPLKNVPKQELLAAAKFLSNKNDVKSLTLPTPKPRKVDNDTISDISEFNKVHVLSAENRGELPTLRPVKPPRSKLNKTITDAKHEEGDKPMENGADPVNIIKGKEKSHDATVENLTDVSQNEQIGSKERESTNDVEDISDVEEIASEKPSASDIQHKVNEGASTSKVENNIEVDKSDDESEYETESEPEELTKNAEIGEVVEGPTSPDTNEAPTSSKQTNNETSQSVNVKPKKRWFSFGKSDKTKSADIQNGKAPTTDSGNQLQPSTGPNSSNNDSKNVSDNTTANQATNANTKPRSKLCNIL